MMILDDDKVEVSMSTSLLPDGTHTELTRSLKKSLIVCLVRWIGPAAVIDAVTRSTSTPSKKCVDPL